MIPQPCKGIFSSAEILKLSGLLHTHFLNYLSAHSSFFLGTMSSFSEGKRKQKEKKTKKEENLFHTCQATH